MKKKYFSERLYSLTAIVLFLIYAYIGIVCYDDYGCGPDEGMERQTALVNFKYVINKLNIPIDKANETWLGYLPELHEYRDRYYGTALHFPLVLIESFFHFTLEPAQFYGLRHFYTFVNYFLGVVCLSKLLSCRFGSNKFGIIGMLLMILYPRFFAESFYNNKDVIFVAWYAICLYLIDKWFRKRNLKNSIIMAFSLALTCNTRFNGIVFIPVLVCLYVFDCLRNKNKSGMKYLLAVLFFTVLFFYLITPNFWEHPLQTLVETLQFNMRHPNHGSGGNLFKGVLVDAAQTYTYIPVWIIITTPVLYLIFILLGTLWYLYDLIRQLVHRDFRTIELTDLAILITGYGAVCFIIFAHVTIYNGWRHCYFAYPCFVYFAVYLLYKLENVTYRAGKCFCTCALAVSMVYNAYWITKNHPYEYVYFSPLFRSSANQYSGDYWGISSRALLEYITEIDPGRVITINHEFTQAGSINRGLLPGNKRDLLELVYDESDAVEYYIICRDDIPNVSLNVPNYQKIYSITVDKDEFAAVYKKAQ